MEEQTTTTMTADISLDLFTGYAIGTATWEDSQSQSILQQLDELTEIQTQQLENQLLMTSQCEQQLSLTFVLIAFVGFLCGLVFASLVRR